ncbi:MAG: C69 family dipeptidase [Deltaproteobacteria bacterium]|nr:C69 family dipeptidase [Deltaproteobacteria bacterium]
MCDTFVALPPHTGGAVVFGKNSDREPNEAQTLEYHPPARHPSGARLRCTYIEIDQARDTFGVLLCRPFWMWGAEMGANERGVVIGNEAVFTRMPTVREKVLTGMDLLRLALERAATADQALETITALLHDHGQGGRCGYRDRRLAYHNSFIIADPAGAWVLETAGPLWAARRVTRRAAISNRLSIGADFDRAHPQLVATARRRGWCRPSESFDFARCFSDRFMTFFAAGGRRRGRSLELLDHQQGRFDAAAAMALLRDHGPGEYRPDGHLLLDRICAHAANPLTRHAAQTTGSLVAVLHPQQQQYWVTGTAAPCTGLFKPVWLEGDVLPPDLGTPGPRCDAESLWWRHERLHRLVLEDFSHRLGLYRRDRNRLEAGWQQAARTASGRERFALTQKAFAQARQATEEWIQQVSASRPARRRAAWPYRFYWRRQNRLAGVRWHR